METIDENGKECFINRKTNSTVIKKKFLIENFVVYIHNKLELHQILSDKNIEEVLASLSDTTNRVLDKNTEDVLD